MSESKTTQRQTTVWKSRWGRTVFGMSIFLAILTVLQVSNYFKLMPTKVLAPFDLIAYFAWTILPPSWFLFEYVWLFSDADKMNSDKVNDLKYTHELAGKIWAALVVLLSVLLYLKYPAIYGRMI